MLFFDKYQKFRDVTSSVTLIEPSQIALERSKHIMQCYAPKAKIVTINKILDNLVASDFQTSNMTTKIHLFSNILDMPVFSIPLLIEKITSSTGENHFIAMSSDRSSYGGSERMEEFCNYFKNDENLNAVKTIKTDYFTVKNPSTYPGSKDFNVRYIYIDARI
jgi:hypothetical protein